jgi:DNA-directed RNA polymerase specialized sigma24 family protein
MSVLHPEPIDDARFEATYTQYFGLLVQVAVHKYQVPDSEAEALAHDVLLGYLRKAETVNVIRSWLIGAICHASRHYWRLNGRTVGEDEADIDPEIAKHLGVKSKYAAKLIAKCLRRAEKIFDGKTAR